MMKPLVAEYRDGVTTEREMTEQEHIDYLKMKKDLADERKQIAAAETAQAAAKTSAYKKLAALGLTADEIAAL